MAKTKASAAIPSSREFSRLAEDINRRRSEPGNFARGRVKKMGDVVSQLLARRGYAQETTATEIVAAWQTAAGESIARQTRVGLVRRGTLDVVVANSVVSQELTFRKMQLIADLARHLPEHKIKNIRFRTGNLGGSQESGDGSM
jgi:predicted nucleic acid-binding Zn ribbon protein